MPASRAGVHGTSLGARIDGYWYVESNYRNADPVGTYLGEYAGPDELLPLLAGALLYLV